MRLSQCAMTGWLGSSNARVWNYFGRKTCKHHPNTPKHTYKYRTRRVALSSLTPAHTHQVQSTCRPNVEESIQAPNWFRIYTSSQAYEYRHPSHKHTRRRHQTCVRICLCKCFKIQFRRLKQLILRDQTAKEVEEVRPAVGWVAWNLLMFRPHIISRRYGSTNGGWVFGARCPNDVAGVERNYHTCASGRMTELLIEPGIKGDDQSILN